MSDIIKNDVELEDLFTKLFNDEIQLSHSRIDKIAYYLLSKKEISSLQLMKFISVFYRIFKLELMKIQEHEND